jgi:calcium-dependent protein kinase
MGCASTTTKKKQLSNDPKPITLVNFPITPVTFRRPSLQNYSHNYKELKKLGSGSFAQVMLCLHLPTHTQRAVKIIKKASICTSQQDSVFILKEFKILRELDHPNIVRCFEVFEDDNCCYISTEYCPAGDLFSEIIKLKKFQESQASEIIKQVLSALVYCHEKGVSHRDLKPENILLMETNENLSIKLADFGNSIEFNNQSKLTGCFGSAYYIAPEVFENFYNESCDIWSVGIIMYVLLTGKPPYACKTNKELIETAQFCPFRLTQELAKNLSVDAISLIKEMVKVNTKQRISAKNALLHPWITKFMSDKSSGSELILNNLKEFNNHSKLKEAVNIFITSQISSYDDLKYYKSCFEAIDKNHDGRITKEELVTEYSKIMTVDEAQNIADDLLEKIDSGKDGKIDYTEFLASCNERQKNISLEKLEIAFNMFDTDRSGTITVDEIREALGNGNSDDDNLWSQIVKEADKNGDGVIDLTEFIHLMTCTVKTSETIQFIKALTKIKMPDF